MIRSAIYGLAVGDALGVPYEFKERGEFNCTEMTGFGTWNQEPGTWSDDTSMTLATCKSIKDKGSIDIEDIKNNFKAWLFEGAFTANGTTFDVGNTTREALTKGQGLDDYYSNGNGSLMRILPLAFVNSSHEEIDQVSAITHGHQLSKEACRLYIGLAKAFIRGGCLRDVLKELQVPDKFSRLPKLEFLKEEEIRSTGFVVDSLEAALWCLVHTNTYKEAMLKAVNLGGDTDTIAAIAGGLGGIMYGYDKIPKTWLDMLVNKEFIEDCLFVPDQL